MIAATPEVNVPSERPGLTGFGKIVCNGGILIKRGFAS
jgi:hypothetical protein